MTESTEGAEEVLDAAAAELDAAQRFLEEGEHTSALAHARAAKSVFDGVLGPANPDSANALLVMSRTHAATGSPGAALVAAREGREVLDAFEVEYGWGGQSAGEALDQLRLYVSLQYGEMLVDAGDYAEAGAELERSLEMAEACDLDGADLARCLNAVGVLARYRGDFEYAQRAYERALRILETHDAPDPNDLATLHHNLAGLAQTRGDPTTGLHHARASIAIRSLALGPDHLLTALDRAVYGAILADLGHHDSAQYEFTKAIAALELAYGPRHPEIAANLHNLGAVAELMGRLGEAERHYAASLEMRDRIFGQGHPDTVDTLHALAGLANAKGHHELARSRRERALDIARRHLDPSHPSRLALERRAGDDASPPTGRV